jgi:TonB-dependent SusC/RagA subfamily outer membrane receptor
MLTIAYYFLQVMVCSGIMFGYYWLVLRNKRFHQYNRFYLLAITVLAWVVPLIKIQWSHPEPDNAQMMQLLAVLADNNSAIEESVGKGRFEWSNDLIAGGLYITVSIFFLVMMVRAMLRLYGLLRKHSCRNVGDVYLILTQAKGTPFSFFRYIFWNDEIDIRSEAGRQILQHELTHVKQRHSIDKVFMQVVLAAGWFNPFFWFIKKEMEMIHEFIADKSAVGDGDTSALANMLLTTVYPKQQFALANPFFFSPIRRRLLMLTNNANPRFSYIRRLVVLPLLGMVVVLFAFRNKDRYPTLSVATVMEDVMNTAAPASGVTAETDNNPQQLILQNNGNAGPVLLDTLIKKKNLKDVLIILDGEKINYDALQKIDPSDIESINVIKDGAGEALYGKDGANGVLKITTKKNRNTAAPVQIRGTLVAGTSQGLHSFSVTDAPLDSLSTYNTEPLIYVDGEKCEDDLRTLDVTDIASVSVLKGGDAIGKYGIAARNGVVEITSKSGTLLRKARTEKIVEGKLLSQTINGIVVSGYQSTPSSLNGMAVNNIKVSGTITGGTFSGTLAPGRSNTASNGAAMGTISATSIPMSEYLKVTGYPAFARSNDNPPSFPGGPAAWEKYVNRKINRHVAEENHAPKGTYTVGVAFNVSKSGEVSNVRAENNPGYGTAGEAVRLVSESPNWKPGERNGSTAGYMSHRVYITFMVK